MIVIGIDPGLDTTGYVIADVNEAGIEILEQKDIKTHYKDNIPRRLGKIFEALKEAIEQFQPKAMVVEKLYSHYKHPTTAALLGEARGVIVLLADIYGMDFFEYSPTKARKSFAGRGNVKSYQVKLMAENISRQNFLSDHTADAFALVVAFSHVGKFKKITLKNDCKN